MVNGFHNRYRNVMFGSTMKVALIGAGGRVGQWVAPWLARHAAVSRWDSRPGPGVQALQALDRAAVAAAVAEHDAVIHLCASVPRGTQSSDPAAVANAWAINVGSVAQTLLAAADAGVPRVLHASSLSVHAHAGLERIGREATPDSIEPYGLSKRVAEGLCSQLAGPLGLDVVSLRLGWPTSDDAAPLWLEPATGNAVPVRLGDGTPVPAMPARDIAGAILGLLGEPPRPGHRIAHLVADPDSVFR